VGGIGDCVGNPDPAGSSSSLVHTLMAETPAGATMMSVLPMSNEPATTPVARRKALLDPLSHRNTPLVPDSPPGVVATRQQRRFNALEPERDPLLNLLADDTTEGAVAPPATAIPDDAIALLVRQASEGIMDYPGTAMPGGADEIPDGAEEVPGTAPIGDDWVPSLVAEAESVPIVQQPRDEGESMSLQPEDDDLVMSHLAQVANVDTATTETSEAE